MARALLHVAEVARYLRVPDSTVRRLIARLELPATRVGREIRVDPVALDRWIAAGGTAQYDTDPVCPEDPAR